MFDSMYSMFNPSSGKFIKKGEMQKQIYFMNYFHQLSLIARAMFEWTGLPSTCDARFLEKTLFFEGAAAFVKHKTNDKILSLPVNIAGNIDLYDLPTSVEVYSNNYHETYNTDEIVLIGNNDDFYPTVMTTYLYSEQLAQARKSANINVKMQKFPIIIKCTDKQRLTMKTLWEKIEDDDGLPTYADKNLDMQIQAIDMKIPFVADKLIAYMHDTYDEYLTAIGINNANTNKKERLITDEANANNMLIELDADTMLTSRKRACDQFKERFNLDIDVKLRRDILPSSNEGSDGNE